MNTEVILKALQNLLSGRSACVYFCIKSLCKAQARHCSQNINKSSTGDVVKFALHALRAEKSAIFQPVIFTQKQLTISVPLTNARADS